MQLRTQCNVLHEVAVSAKRKVKLAVVQQSSSKIIKREIGSSTTVALAVAHQKQ
jgi:hypothetical protein